MGCSSQSTSQTPATTSSPAASSSPISASPAANATPSPGSQVAVKPSIEACTLLTSDEIKAVQGNAVKETTPSNRMVGNFIVTQCYYALPTLSNSVSVMLTERNPNVQGAESIHDYWERTFGKDENKSEREREREREERKKEVRSEGEEEEEGAPMEPVRGVGDEAFWSASRVGGALYVLKRDRYLRISVGGAGGVETKLKKSKALALKALKRM
ncbi:MAG TPA: hypothetical protein VJT71_19625 [Pyrinomonadaceae bacterium]|nr:hypothetical protein [Pyrinomonadaceae bacterium]